MTPTETEFTIPQLARRFQVPERSFQRWLKDGRIRGHKVPGRGRSIQEWRIPQTELATIERLVPTYRRPSNDLREWQERLWSGKACGPPPLTKRESEVLKLAAEGLENTEIANRLAVSGHTIKNTFHNLYAKTGASDRLDLIALARSGRAQKEEAVKEEMIKIEKPGAAVQVQAPQPLESAVSPEECFEAFLPILETRLRKNGLLQCNLTAEHRKDLTRAWRAMLDAFGVSTEPEKELT